MPDQSILLIQFVLICFWLALFSLHLQDLAGVDQYFTLAIFNPYGTEEALICIFEPINIQSGPLLFLSPMDVSC